LQPNIVVIRMHSGIVDKIDTIRLKHL